LCLTVAQDLKTRKCVFVVSVLVPHCGTGLEDSEMCFCSECSCATL